MSFLDDLVNRFGDVIDAVLVATSQLEFCRGDPQHLYCAALLSTSIRLAEGVHHSLYMRDEICSFVLLRSLMEASVDLINLVRDPNYVYFMLATLRDQQKKMLKNDSQQQPGGAFSFGSSSEQHDTLRHHVDDLSQLKGRGYRPLSVRERFVRADRLDDYNGPYALVCMQSHNNINVLEDRHLRIEGKDFSIRAFPGLSDHHAQMISGMAAPLLVGAVAAARSVVEEAENAVLEPVDRSLQELRALWTPEDTAV